MQRFEISLLAAGAVVSLVAGGATARLALAPLDAAYAEHRQAPADTSAHDGRPVAASAPIEAQTVAYRYDVPPAAEYGGTKNPTVADAWDDSPSLGADFGDSTARDRDSGPRVFQDAPAADSPDKVAHAEIEPDRAPVGDHDARGPDSETTDPQWRYAVAASADDTRPTEPE